MRCPSCEKFVSFETESEPEEENQDITGTDFSTEYRRVLTCAECGDELKSHSIEFNHDLMDEMTGPNSISSKCNGSPKEAPKVPLDAPPIGDNSEEPVKDEAELEDEANEEHEWEIEEAVAEATTEPVMGKNKKPLKNTVSYGIKLHVICTCARCGESIEFDCEDPGVQSSEMEEV